jgi:hypothetical protein
MGEAVRHKFFSHQDKSRTRLSKTPKGEGHVLRWLFSQDQPVLAGGTGLADRALCLELLAAPGAQCVQEPLDAALPAPHVGARDPRFATQERHTPPADEQCPLVDFPDDAAPDGYTCQQGQV